MCEQPDDLGQRIERLALAPETIAAPWTRLFRPALYRFRWAPKTQTKAIELLLLQTRKPDLGSEELFRSLLKEALVELKDNVVQIERATIVAARPLTAHNAWLRRIYELLCRLEMNAPVCPFVDQARILPPMAYDAARLLGDSAEGSLDEGSEVPAASSRLLELRLDTIDHLMAAARQEDTFLGRRRRLLEAARRMLLETSAALPLPEESVQRRLQSIAAGITKSNRAEAAGVSPVIALIQQARSAMARNEHSRLRHVLELMRGAADENGHWLLSQRVNTALQGLERFAPAGDDALEQSLTLSFGEEVAGAVRAGYAQARVNGAELSEDSHFDEVMAEVVADYLVPGTERDTLANALAVDGCFEVGGVMTPVRVTERHVRHIEVSYPTQDVRLVPASSPLDLPASIIGDPRTLILDLAAGRLLTRRYRQETHEYRSREVLQGEVRVYLLDGSSSMLGPRARMRDAIMVAELATLIKRLSDPDRHTRVKLYFRYFNTKLGTLHKVDSRGSALEAIRIVTGTPRIGGTDIETALLSSLEQVRQSKEEDPELARAQIVLVTDGDAWVSEQQIEEAQEKLGDLPVGVSIIALGEQNQVLRSLVAKQRRRGEKAFYHFLPDSYLRSLSAAEMDASFSLPPPAVLETLMPAQEQFDTAMRELDDACRAHGTMIMRSLDEYDRAALLERSSVPTLDGEGERSRLEAARRDYGALQRRYARWFPRGLASSGHAPNPGTLEAEDVESAIVIFATIADVIEAVSSDQYSRMADSLDLFERLLPDARLSPGRYTTIISLYPAALAPALNDLHAAVDAKTG